MPKLFLGTPEILTTKDHQQHVCINRPYYKNQRHFRTLIFAFVVVDFIDLFLGLRIRSIWSEIPLVHQRHFSIWMVG